VIKFKIPVDETHLFHNVKADSSRTSVHDHDSQTRRNNSDGFSGSPRSRSHSAGEKRQSFFGENRRRKHEFDDQTRKARSDPSAKTSSFFSNRAETPNSYQERSPKSDFGVRSFFGNKSRDERTTNGRSRDGRSGSFSNRNQRSSTYNSRSDEGGSR